MKICTVTCNNADNYGARLQAYALTKYLDSLGHESTIVDYNPEYVEFRTKLWYNPGSDIKEWIKMPLRYRRRCQQIEKHRRLEDFSRKFTRLTAETYYDIDDLRKNPPEADVYIAGSDQIWNTDFKNGRDPVYYLDFGPVSVKRLSYAASFAIPMLPEKYTDQIQRWLRRFDALSIREESGLNILKSLGFDATLVCDPVFLLDSSEWDEIADSQVSASKPYLLIYDFESSAQVRKVAERIARIRGLDIYSVSPLRLGYAHRNFCDCGAEQFIGLIKNADCVVSNSLHGSVFSMIYQRDFYVVNRLDGLNVRMADLLARHGLKQRIVGVDCDDNTLKRPIDYTVVEDSLQQEINRSKDWLKQQLSKV